MATHVKVLRVSVWNYPNISKAVTVELQAIVRKHSLLVIKDMRDSFKRPKTGRIYYYKGKAIRASAPGEPPAIRSGRLYKNVKPIVQNSGMQVTIDPVANVGHPYPKYLEKGTTKMLPRPYIGPAVERRRKAFLSETRARLAKAMANG